MKQLDGTGMKRLHRQWRKRDLAPMELLIDGIGGPYNLGSIIRTAAAYRLDQLWIAGSQIDPSNTKVQRTALGTDRYVQWTSVDSAASAAADARARGLHVVGIELADDAVPITDLALDGPTCLVLGHEDRGISPATLGECDTVAYLPQLGKIGSLNLATAASIALWEVRRRGWTETDE